MNDNPSGSVSLVNPVRRWPHVDVVRDYYARHAKADDVQHNCAAFTWSEADQAFQIEVRGYIVAEFPQLAEVVAFCLMHNSRIAPTHTT